MKKILYLLPTVLWATLTACNQPEAVITDIPVKISNKGVNIAYTDNKSTADTTLLFVHGWCINKTYWTEQVAYFDKKYRVVTMDLPGFGQSGKNRKVWNTETFAHDVDSVMAQLQLKNVVLVGHSMAGDIILQSAINSPGRVIALAGVDNFKSVGVGPVSAEATKKAKAEYADAIHQLKTNFKATAFAWINQELFYKTTDINIRRRVLNDVAHADTTIAAACMDQDDFSESTKLLQAKKKLYLINSTFGPTDTTGLIGKKIPYRLFYVHDTGHFPMIEKPQVFNAQLAKVLKDLAGR